MKKKNLPAVGLTLAVVGAVGAVSAPTYADYYDDVEPRYVSCGQIAEKLSQYDKIYLTEDGCSTNLVVPSGANSVLDLGAHDLSAANGIAVYVPAGATLTVTSQNKNLNGATGQNTIVNYGTLIIEGTTVNGNVANYGDLVFKDADTAGGMLINYNGTMKTAGNYNHFGNSTFYAPGGEIALSVGSFSMEPVSEFIAKGYQAILNENTGEWTIQYVGTTEDEDGEGADAEGNTETGSDENSDTDGDSGSDSNCGSDAGSDSDGDGTGADENGEQSGDEDVEVEVSALSSYMAVGSAEYVTVTPESALKSISSRDESVIAVSGNQITALHPGSTTVVVSTSKGDFSYTIRVYDLYSSTVSGANYDAMRSALNATLTYYAEHPDVSNSISEQVVGLMDAIENGSLLSSNLGINNAGEVDEEVVNGMRAKLDEGYNLTPFYDVFVSASDDAGVVQDVRLSELATSINIALPLPESLVNTSDGRDFYVIYRHKDANTGETSYNVIRDVTLRTDLKAIAFSANQFSIYTVAYSGDVVSDDDFIGLVDDSYVDPLAVGETVEPVVEETPTAAAPDTGRMTNEDAGLVPVRILAVVAVLAVLAVAGKYGYKRFITHKGIEFESYDE